MTYNANLSCKQCGNPLKFGSRFCGSCGFPVSGTHATNYPSRDRRSSKTKSAGGPTPDELGFPDVNESPRLGAGLKSGWNIFSRDIWGSVVCALVLFIGGSLIIWVPVLGQMAVVALLVGFYGWVESVRNEGKKMQVGVMVNKALDSFGQCVGPGVVLFVFWLLLVCIPLVVTFIFTTIWTIATGTYSHAGGGLMDPPVAVWYAFYGTLALAGLLVPIMASWTMITAWGIYKGAGAAETMTWAWDRIKNRPVAWWLNGFVLTFVSIIGVLAGYIGMVFTIPWTQTAWYEVISAPATPVRDEKTSDPTITVPEQS